MDVSANARAVDATLRYLGAVRCRTLLPPLPPGAQAALFAPLGAPLDAPVPAWMKAALSVLSPPAIPLRAVPQASPIPLNVHLHFAK